MTLPWAKVRLGDDLGSFAVCFFTDVLPSSRITKKVWAKLRTANQQAPSHECREHHPQPNHQQTHQLRQEDQQAPTPQGNRGCTMFGRKGKTLEVVTSRLSKQEKSSGPKHLGSEEM